MADAGGFPEDRFKAFLGRLPSAADRERLDKVRAALGIAPNDAVWDVMIALDYHLQLYAQLPRQIADETDKAAARLRALLEVKARTPSARHADVTGAPTARDQAARTPATTLGAVAAVAVVFGGLCIAAGYAIAGRGGPPWGAAGGLGAVLGAPAGWLAFVLLLPAASRWVRAGWAAGRSPDGFRVRAVGWLLMLASLGLVVAGLAVLAMALRR